MVPQPGLTGRQHAVVVRTGHVDGFFQRPRCMQWRRAAKAWSGRKSQPKQRLFWLAFAPWGALAADATACSGGAGKNHLHDRRQFRRRAAGLRGRLDKIASRFATKGRPVLELRPANPGFEKVRQTAFRPWAPARFRAGSAAPSPWSATAASTGSTTGSARTPA